MDGDNPDYAELVYRRDGDSVRLKIQHMTNHELGALIVGLWLRFDDENRAGMIRELEHLQGAGTWPSAVSASLALAIGAPELNPMTIDLTKYHEGEWRED